MNWYLDGLKNYTGFSGRAHRTEFWMFALINFVVAFVIAVIPVVNFLSPLYALAVLLPSLAVAMRRLHDTGRSGWWLLLLLIPVLGWAVLLIFYCIDSEPGENAFGPNPKGAAPGSISQD